MRKLTFQLSIAILTFTLGVTATVPWAFNWLHLLDFTNSSNQSQTRSAKVLKEPIPQGWHKVNAKHLFTLYLPASMQLSNPEQSIESVWGSTFSDERVKLYAEYGSWNGEYAPEYLAKQLEYEKELTQISGKRAKVESWRTDELPSSSKYIAEARVYRVDGDGNGLSLSALCKEESDVKMAKQIFRTVELP